MRKCTILVFIVLMFLSVTAQAAVIAEVSGTGYGGAGIGEGNGQQAAAMGFSTSIGATNVSISSPITVTYEDATIDAYLTNQLGSGTTAANVLDHTQIIVPVNTTTQQAYSYDDQFTDVTFFSGLTLAPGNYYLTLVTYNQINTTGVAYAYSGFDTITSIANVSTVLGTYGAAQQNGNFAPAYGFSDNSQASLFAGYNVFTVTGTLTPEPGSAALSVTLVISALTLRRRCSAASL